MRTVSPIVVTKSRNPVTVLVTILVFPDCPVVASFLSQSNCIREVCPDSTGCVRSPEISDFVEEVSSFESTANILEKKIVLSARKILENTGIFWKILVNSRKIL